jgi:hypothetical protein
MFSTKKTEESMLASPDYSKSAQCALWINEVADVSIRIGTDGVIYSLNSLPYARDSKPAKIVGASDGSNPDFSIMPLIISETILTVNGFLINAGGIGPVRSGHLVLELHMWAVSGISRIVLGTNRAVDVRFCFGSSKQLSSTDPTQLVTPWAQGAMGGTPFSWPGS